MSGLGTTPRTWVAGETVTAAMMNAEIRDNMNALGAGTIMATPTSTASAGTSTAGGAVEIREAVLGNYTFTAVAGRRYEAKLAGATYASTVAGDVVKASIRNGGGSTPTTSSTLVCVAALNLATSGVYATCMPVGTFVPGAGTVTLSAFTQRNNGTGTISVSGTRELYVLDIGPA